jgi:hypothetical protein
MSATTSDYSGPDMIAGEMMFTRDWHVIPASIAYVVVVLIFITLIVVGTG